MRIKFWICRSVLLLAVASLWPVGGVFSQQQKEVPKASPSDVATMDSILHAVYDVISGPSGQARDWDRFRSLFLHDARLISVSLNPAGEFQARGVDPEGYAARASGYFEKNGFFEKEIARHTDRYGNIAQVFSTYESRHQASDSKPFARGINSFQLFNDGHRWWIVTIYWQGESEKSPIPSKYLK